MKPYLIIYENGNGYHCHCCRSTWKVTDTMEFENDEAAKKYAEDYNKEQKTSKEDSEVENIYALESSSPVV